MITAVNRRLWQCRRCQACFDNTSPCHMGSEPAPL